MLKRTFKFTDYNGVEREEDHYFNLSQAELMRMQYGKVGGFVNYLKKIIATQSGPELYKIFEDLVQQAYGTKSDDGRRFIKSQEITDEFVQTEAYSMLVMELTTDDQAAADFINGIVPADVAQKAAQQQAAQNAANHPALK